MNSRRVSCLPHEEIYDRLSTRAQRPADDNNKNVKKKEKGRREYIEEKEKHTYTQREKRHARKREIYGRCEKRHQKKEGRGYESEINRGRWSEQVYEAKPGRITRERERARRKVGCGEKARRREREREGTTCWEYRIDHDTRTRSGRKSTYDNVGCMCVWVGG